MTRLQQDGKAQQDTATQRRHTQARARHKRRDSSAFARSRRARSKRVVEADDGAGARGRGARRGRRRDGRVTSVGLLGTARMVGTVDSISNYNSNG
jgi:hypothetical protein